MKNRAREAAMSHVGQTAREVPQEHREASGKKTKREERIVIRLNADELRRLEIYCETRGTMISTAVRGFILEALRH